ncbi:hypothetical protein JHK86_013894 [Glycine max]|nr:hypothetical protein JHK86_013894 [Glycine max]
MHLVIMCMLNMLQLFCLPSSALFEHPHLFVIYKMLTLVLLLLSHTYTNIQLRISLAYAGYRSQVILLYDHKKTKNVILL